MAISGNLSESDYKNALQPVAPSERIQELDILRGFALFGVLLAYTLWNLGSPPGDQWSNADRLLNGVLSVLIDTKFYTLFAFLFGLGFAIQLTRAEARGVSVVPVYVRRLLALLLIGLAHALLLRNGDILVPYAVMGFILLLFRRASNKALLVGGIIGLVYPYLARGVWDSTGIPFPKPPTTEGKSYLAENFAWVQYWYSIAIQAWPASLPMFLAGLYVGRRRFFENLSAYTKKLKWVLIAGLSLGVIALALQVLLPGVMPRFRAVIFSAFGIGSSLERSRMGTGIFLCSRPSIVDEKADTATMACAVRRRRKDGAD